MERSWDHLQGGKLFGATGKGTMILGLIVIQAMVVPKFGLSHESLLAIVDVADEFGVISIRTVGCII